MPACPQCNKPLRELVRRCPTCQADLDLLVDYVSNLQGSLERAENLTRAGELGQAMWAYLEVLEVDPDNPTARRQVAQVATAVRQFDLTAPGRRWLNTMRGGNNDKSSAVQRALWSILLVGVLILGFSAGFFAGSGITGPAEGGNGEPPPKPANTLGR